MLIILEGVDGSGKSTLAGKLVESLPSARLLHKGPIKDHPLYEYEYPLTTYDPNKDDIICDRWHVGELIYGPLYRGQSKLTPAMNRHIELFLRSRGALKLHMDTDRDVVRKRLDIRGDDLVQFNHINLIIDFYQDYADREGWVPVSDFSSIVEPIISTARQYQAIPRFLKKWPSYVGGMLPKALLVGEGTYADAQRNRPVYSSTFVPYADTSGHRLLSALEAVNERNSYGLVSPKDKDLTGLWKGLGRPRIVALGNVAREVIRAAELPLAKTVSAPAWRGLTYTQYGNILKGAIHG